MLQIEEQIIKLSKKGITPSQIGVTLRDSHGVTQVRSAYEVLGIQLRSIAVSSRDMSRPAFPATGQQCDWFEGAADLEKAWISARDP